MIKIEFNFNDFHILRRVCHSLAACQRHTPSSLAAVIGLSNNDVIALRPLRSLRCVRWMETPLHSTWWIYIGQSRKQFLMRRTMCKACFSKRAFCHASPTVWNTLPQTVISDLTVTTGTFKNRLKSALYCLAFLQWLVTCQHLRFFTIVDDLTCV